MSRLQPVPDRPRRMIAYIRQSVAREESISPEVQERTCRDHIARRGDQVVEVIADVGISGLKWEKRPGIQRAMRMIAAGEADGIVVWRWSRLSRRRIHQAMALDAIEKAGGVVESATEPFDATTAGGRFSREVLLAAAAMESEQKAEQWRDAWRRRLEIGLPASGGPRFGYRLIGGKRGEPTENVQAEVYVADTETAPILAECYRRYLAGQGMQQITDWLNAMRVPPPRAKTREWSKRGLTYMLDAGFAAGMLHSHSAGTYTRGAHEPIIDETTWARYRAERKRRSTVAPRFLHPAWRLAGIVKCGSCGYSMTLNSHTGPASHLRCNRRGCDGRPLVPLGDVEAAVLAWLPTVADEIERLAQERPTAVVRTERNRLARAVADADRALRNLLVDKAKGQVPAAVFDAAIADLARDRERAQQLLDKAEEASVQLDGVADASESLAEIWSTAGAAEVNAVARNLLTVQVTRLSWGSRHAVPEFRIDVKGVWEL